jgi:hypothetical protein
VSDSHTTNQFNVNNILFDRWSANAIFDKNLLSIVFFLLHLVDHFTRMGRVSVDLPKAVRVNVIRLTKKDGAAHPEKLEAVENIIG